MYKNKKIVCIIPARKNSKGIKNKNLSLINNKPLIYYPIKNALSSKVIDKVYINSDSNKILNAAKKIGKVINFKRPNKLGKDNTKIFEVISNQIHKLNLKKDYQILILLEPTSPFSSTKDIDNALRKMIRGDYDSFVSVSKKSIPRIDYEVKVKNHLINSNKKITKNRQDYKYRYLLCGIFYISKLNTYLKNKTFLQNKTGFLEVKNEKIIEIDDAFDLKLARLLYN